MTDGTPIQRRLSAVLSADVVGYSRLIDNDDLETLRALEENVQLISEIVSQHGGRVVDAVGDNLLAEFGSSTAAVDCGLDVQRELGVRNMSTAESRRLEFRIGINLGEIIVSGERVAGTGVNVAARLQQLASPGGVAISGIVHDQLPGEKGDTFEFKGMQSLKNIPRPVAHFEAGGASDRDSAERTVDDPGEESRPAIAVLPFQPESSDTEWLARGISQDLVTRLSLCRYMPVIAPVSSFADEAASSKVEDTARALGAGYVVLGSVASANERVRIRCQLVESDSGRTVWSNHYDHSLDDLFALQDEITESIIAALHGELFQFETERAHLADPANLDAWSMCQRGWWHLYRLTHDDAVEARSCFQAAAKSDPKLAQAQAGLALTHYVELIDSGADDPGAAISELTRFSRAAMALDSRDPFGLLATAAQYTITNQPADAKAAFELAIDINPSQPLVHLLYGSILSAAGEPERGESHLEHARKLSPRDPFMWLYYMGKYIARFAVADYAAAAEAASQVVKLKPDTPSGFAFLATSYAYLGRREEAAEALATMLKMQPNFSAEGLGIGLASADPDYTRRVIEGLRLAGWTG